METHNRMLNNIPNIYDRSVGSFFYDATKPVAIEIDEINKNIGKELDRYFADTAIKKDLERVCSTKAIFRKLATYSSGEVLIKGSIGSMVKQGQLVSSDSLIYVIQEDCKIDNLDGIHVAVKCEKSGSIGNIPTGAIKKFPITIEGVYLVTNEKPITNGYDEESDEDLRARYYVKVRTPETSGNIYSYENWTKEVTGVGQVKIYPCGDGAGTVKIVIVDSNNMAATQELIKKVFDNIESKRPIGVTVRVVSAIEKKISITVKVVLENGADIAVVKKSLNKHIDEYFRQLTFKSTYISYAKIGNLILNVEGVLDYSDLKLNGTMANVTLVTDEIPIISDINMEV